ncbi:MAG: cyclic nucleotide-binding domain-containing protein [Piscinibacter sp.]
MPSTPVTPDPLHDELLREIAARGNVKQYPANAVIINEGDAADSLFIVLAGRVKVYAANKAGKEVILSTLGPGEYVGELALDGGTRSASVMTMEPTRCAVVTGASLRDFLAAHPGLRAAPDPRPDPPRAPAHRQRQEPGAGRRLPPRRRAAAGTVAAAWTTSASSRRS